MLGFGRCARDDESMLLTFGIFRSVDIEGGR